MDDSGQKAENRASEAQGTTTSAEHSSTCAHVLTPEPGAQSISGLNLESWCGLLQAIGMFSTAHIPASPSHGKSLSCAPNPGIHSGPRQHVRGIHSGRRVF